MKDYLKTVVEGHMSIYKTAFEEGRKTGYHEGYIKGLNEAQEIATKVFGKGKTK
jgi:flagellar biosynthesis/type III secretory pathway protein FliH